MNFGKQFLASLLGSTVALIAAGTILIFIFVGALVGGLSSAFAESGTDIESEFDFGVDIEEGSVLHLTFDAPFVERGMEVPSFSFSIGGVDAESQTGLNHFLADMERAAQDDRIEGILIQADMVIGYPSMLGEVRDALVSFKESGKWVVAWSEVYTQSAYWISTVADEVYLHPEGGIDMRGMGMETMFFKRMLEDVGIEMTIVRGPDNKYKSAVEPFFRESLSEANREQNMALLEDFWARMGGDIATARDKSVAELDGEIGVALRYCPGLRRRELRHRGCRGNRGDLHRLLGLRQQEDEVAEIEALVAQLAAARRLQRLLGKNEVRGVGAGWSSRWAP